MAKKRTAKKASRRGSAEAIEKRRVARELNRMLSAESGGVAADGRTEKRRQRLLRELREGRRGEALKPIDILQHAHELLELGENITSVKKACSPTYRAEITSD